MPERFEPPEEQTATDRLVGISGLNGELVHADKPPYLKPAESNNNKSHTPQEIIPIAEPLQITFNPILVGKPNGTLESITNDRTVQMRLNPKDRDPKYRTEPKAGNREPYKWH